LFLQMLKHVSSMHLRVIRAPLKVQPGSALLRPALQEQLAAVIVQTDAVLQNGLRALELANRVLTITGPSWVADRALTAAEIAMAAAVQRLNHLHGVAQQLHTVAAAAQQTRANSAALSKATDDETEDDLRDTCTSILRELGDSAQA
jgi:glutathione S-transferase